MHVSIIVPQGQAVVSSIVGPFKVLNAVNQFLIETGQRSDEFYKIDLVAANQKGSYYGGLFEVNPTKTIDQVGKTDLIIVTTVAGDPQKAVEGNLELYPWIRDQRVENDAEVASLCTGAVLLASTGLLNGKPAATHWVIHEPFRMMFPEVNLLPDKIITEDGGIYTSGGAYSFLNLILHLVEKYNGRETAIWVSKLFEIEFGRDHQNQFVIFRGQKEHADESIKNAQEYIEQNVSEKISIEDLANRVAISRRNFVRRFKKATSNTPLEYVQRVKIEVAKKYLESTTKNISEVMYDVGYNDDKAFRNVFRKLTGLSPHEYRLKYNREMALVGS